MGRMSQIVVHLLGPLSSDSAQLTDDTTPPAERSEQGHFLRMCFRSLEAKLSALRMNLMPLGDHTIHIRDEITTQEGTLACLHSKIQRLQTQRETLLSLAQTPRPTSDILQSVAPSQESAVADLDFKIINLQVQRDVTTKSLAVTRALLAPIRRLPTEILAEIFEHCLPSKCSRNMSDSEIFEHRFRVGSPIVNRTSNDAPFLFLRICRRWRDVAQCTARLWTDVPMCCNDSIPYASICLQNSRSLPLDIRISSIQRGDQCRSTWQRRAAIDKGQVVFSDILKGCPKFQQTLLERLPFARRLEFDGSFEVLSILFPPGGPTKLEVLEELIIESMSIPGEHSLSSLKASRLHTLALYDSLHLITSIEPTSSLRRLTLSAISDATIGPLYDFLRRCTELEELFFHCDIDQFGRGDEAEDPIHLASLLKLEIDSDNATELLGLLRAPKLQSAVLCYDPTDWQPLQVFFQVARTSLSHLALSRFHLASPLLHNLISSLSELETLTLENCNTDGGFWESLTPAGSHPEYWMCPKLKYLDLCRTPVGAEFIEFIRTRGYTSLEGGGPRSGWENIVDIKLRECNIHFAVARSLRCLQLDRRGPSILGLSTDDIDNGGIGVDEPLSGKMVPK